MVVIAGHGLRAISGGGEGEKFNQGSYEARQTAGAQLTTDMTAAVVELMQNVFSAQRSEMIM